MPTENRSPDDGLWLSGRRIAPALFETADMRAGIDGLIEHGPRQFRNKVIFEGR